MSNIIKTGKTKSTKFTSFRLPEISEERVSSRTSEQSCPFEPLEDENAAQRDVQECSEKKTELLIKEAKQNAALIEKEAYEKGFTKGEKEAFELGREKIETIVNNLSEMLVNLDHYKEGIFEEAQEEVVRMVLTICQRVISHEISINKEVIINSVKEAFKYVTDKSGVHIKVNPEDLTYLTSYKQDLPKFVEGLKHLEITGDQSIESGGCVIETGLVTVDGRIEHKLDAIARVVDEELKKDDSIEDRSE